MIHHVEQSINFWNELWDNPVYHDKSAYWMMRVEKKSWSVLQNKLILASLRRLFPYV